MKAKLRRIMSAAIVLALVSGDAAWAQTVQVQLSQGMRLKRRGVLVSEAVIPPGSVVEVSMENFNRPRTMPRWRSASEQIGQDEFVGGIRLVRAPGFSARDIEELNRSFGGARGLFMRKSVISEATVVAQLNSDQDVRLRTTGPGAVYRRHTPDPAEERGESLTRGDAQDLVERIEEGNRAARTVGEGASCRRFKDSWVRAGVPARALEKALQMFEKESKPGGKIKNRDYITIADFTKHSGRKRLFVLNTKTGKVEKFYTSHGNGHGSVSARHATKFSSRNNSFLTPPGFHVTGDSVFYHRRLKQSLRMIGIEDRNRSSSSRGILIHQAQYASDSFVENTGYTGRSWGCLTIDPRKAQRVLSMIEGGSLIYNYTGE